ncbi:MAG: tetratricopeptide repeat protein [Caldilineaceae bacterium]|nr:tetratricopeptide repeat protein [Caldilineaceae bacterium]
MYLDRTYHPRRRTRGFARFWPLFLALFVGVILYEEQPTWLIPQSPLPTPTPTRSAIFYQASAESALRAGNYDAAFTAYREMSRLEPTNPDSFIALSELHLIFRDAAAALREAQRAVGLAPTDPDALTARARALNWGMENDDAAIDAFNALDIDPNHVFTDTATTEIYTDVGNREIAARYLDQALALDPNDVLALRNKAYLLERSRDYEAAAAAYEAAIAVAPKRFDLYIEYGRLLRVGMANFEKAVEEYRKAVAVYEAPITLDALGDGLYNNGDHLQAVRELRKAVEMDPNYGWAQVHLGMALYARRNYEDAATHLDIGLTLVGDEARIEQLYTAGLAYVYKEPRECDKALPWLEKALALDSRSAPALDGVTRCSQAPSTDQG